MNDPDRFDLTFSVPQVHRVRFTRDVLGDDAAALLEVLQPAADGLDDDGLAARRARVVAFVDAGVEAAAGVAGRLGELARRHPVLDLAGVHVLAAGETLKNQPDRLLPVLEALRDANVDRRSYVLAVGGGALLDAVGFAAALAHRGVRLVRLPTTTMGQADSGVGVKNAINFFGKKNWLGTFATPWAVINDERLLSTLPDRDFRAGLSEAVKVALLKDPAFFATLERDAPAITRREPAAVRAAVRRSAHWHLMHITRGGDPFEEREARPLDFGHWLAHRLEAMADFTLRHGEAVAIGLAVDCTYSTLAHGLAPESCRRVLGTLAALQLPLTHPLLAEEEALLEGLEEFRQHLGGRLTVTMLEAIGRPLDVHAIDTPRMREAIRGVSMQYNIRRSI